MSSCDFSRILPKRGVKEFVFKQSFIFLTESFIRRRSKFRGCLKKAQHVGHKKKFDCNFKISHF